MLTQQTVVLDVIIRRLRHLTTLDPVVDQQTQFRGELCHVMINETGFAVNNRISVDDRRREHHNAIARALDKFQIGFGAIEDDIAQRQQRNIRPLQNLFVLRVRHNLTVIIIVVAEEIFLRALNLIEQPALGDHIELDLVAVIGKHAVERRHNLLNVLVAIERAEENCHRAILFRLLIEVARGRQHRQMIAEHADIRIEMTEQLGKIFRRRLHAVTRDKVDELIALVLFAPPNRVVVHLLDQQIAAR